MLARNSVERYHYIRPSIIVEGANMIRSQGGVIDRLYLAESLGQRVRLKGCDSKVNSTSLSSPCPVPHLTPCLHISSRDLSREMQPWLAL
jgi:hypothetical protein